MAKKKKKKKEKVTYIDDGRTIADMSGTSKNSAFFGNRPTTTSAKGRRRASAREQWQTYKTAARQMFFPMLVVMGIITVAFGCMYLLFKYGT
ncbi:MAG: hypothetical protein J6Q69_04600 [Clostridia bacterium]|nr:hypothetical protein [Clostridia bacterium]